METGEKRPPAGLKAAGKAVWRAVTAEFEPNAAESELLFQLGLTVDELKQMKSELSRTGMLVEGSQGQPRINPIIAAITAHRKLVDQLVVALGVPLPGETVGRRRSAAAKQSVDSRWRQEKRRGRLASVETLRPKEGN